MNTRKFKSPVESLLFEGERLVYQNDDAIFTRIEQVKRVAQCGKIYHHFWGNMELLTATLDMWFKQFEGENIKLSTLCSLL